MSDRRRSRVHAVDVGRERVEEGGGRGREGGKRARAWKDVKGARVCQCACERGWERRASSVRPRPEWETHLAEVAPSISRSLVASRASLFWFCSFVCWRLWLTSMSGATNGLRLLGYLIFRDLLWKQWYIEGLCGTRTLETTQLWIFFFFFFHSNYFGFINIVLTMRSMWCI